MSARLCQPGDVEVLHEHEAYHGERRREQEAERSDQEPEGSHGEQGHGRRQRDHAVPDQRLHDIAFDLLDRDEQCRVSPAP